MGRPGGYLELFFLIRTRSAATRQKNIKTEPKDAIGKPKMIYMHQVRSLSTKGAAPVKEMGAIGRPELKYTHQVRSLSTKEGEVPPRSVSRVHPWGGGCMLVRSRDIWGETKTHLHQITDNPSLIRHYHIFFTANQ